MDRRIAMLCLLTLVATAGCAYWIEGPSATRPPEQPVPLQSASSAALILEDIEVVVNETAARASPAFWERFARAMRQPGLFGSVYDPFSMQETPPRTARARLRVVENDDGHRGAGVAKGALVGLSLFALAPVLPLRVDKTASMQLSVDLPDGQRRLFHVTASATAYVELWSDAQQAGTELDAAVTRENLEALAVWLAADPAIRAYLHPEDAV